MRQRIGLVLLLSMTLFQTGMAQNPAVAGAEASAIAVPVVAAPAGDHPLLQLGPGDQVKVEVYGRPEMDTTTYIADNGTVSVPLAGSVEVGGLSPSDAARKVEAALKNGQYLVNPHVTFSVVQSRSQRVSIVGEVRLPGRYPVESNTTILDVIALAGGLTDKASGEIYVLRQDASGNVTRLPANVQTLTDPTGAAPSALLTLRGGDRIFVPTAKQLYVTGAVTAPASYRFESGLTVLQAVARAGGVTARGSMRRIEIKRLLPNGTYTIISAKPGDLVQPDDVITVKERLF